MLTGDRRLGAATAVLALVLGAVAVVLPPAAAAWDPYPTPADCTIVAVDGKAAGTPGDDIICGTPGNDVLVGGGGDDAIFGLGGNDYIDAGAGADFIDGGYGADEILLGPGDDYAAGGPGGDRLWGGDGIDDLNGGSGDDSLTGGAGADDLDGGAGVDYCRRSTGDTATSCYFDTSRPRLVAVAVGTRTVDTSSADKVVSVRVHVRDSGTGVGSIALTFGRHLTTGAWVNEVELQAWTDGARQYCTAYNHAPPPVAGGEATVCLVSGTSRDGVFELRTVLPRWSPQGRYILSGVKLRDLAGNGAGLSWDTLVERRLAVSFTQAGAGDSLAPLVRDVRLLTPGLDTSGDRRVLGVRTRVTDGMAGVSGFELGFSRVKRDRTGQIVQYYLPQVSVGAGGSAPVCAAGTPTAEQLYAGDRPWACREPGGTVKDAWYRSFTVLPRWMAKGTYELVTASARDRAGNSKFQWDGELAARGVTASFAQTGTGDVAPPSLAGATMTVGQVSTGIDPADVTARIHVTDSVSGIAWVSLRFRAPGGIDQGVELIGNTEPCTADVPHGCLVSGSARDAVIDVQGTVLAHAAAGRWTLYQVDLFDRAGNSVNLTGSQIPALSFVND
jgi:hypothetical protein